MTVGRFMHCFSSLLAAWRRIVAVGHTVGWRGLALGLLCCQPVLAWAGAAGVSYQLYLDSDGLPTGGCTEAAAGAGGGSAGFEFRLQVTLDAQGVPLPARWSLCRAGAFVDVAASPPIDVLASNTLSGPGGLEDVLDLAVPWALLGDATAVRVRVSAGADVLDSGTGGGTGAIWLLRSETNSGPAPGAGAVQAVPALQPVLQGVLVLGVVLLAAWAWRRTGPAALAVGGLCLLLMATPWQGPAWAEQALEWPTVGVDAAADVPAASPDLLSLQAQTRQDTLYLRLRSRGNNHAPTWQPAAPPLQYGLAGQTAELKLQALDPDGEALRWQWQGQVPAELSLEPDAQTDTGVSGVSGATVTARFDQPGRYSAQLLVSDAAGAQALAVLTWEVAPAPLEPDPDAGPCGVLGGGGLSTGGVDRAGLSYVTATDYTTLKQYLDRLEPFIHVPAGVTIDIPNRKYAVVLHRGQTLFGDRGQDGQPGALLRVAYEDEQPHEWAVFSLDTGSRISGLRIEGPYQAANTANNTIGLQLAVDALDIEVDNSEIYGWPWAAVSVKASRQARIHHNHIHHNIKSGLGYGVVVQNGRTSADIACNVFHFNRHAVAGSGQAGERYEVHHNLVRPGGGRDAYHQVDMHAYPNTTQAGAFLDIHDNWFDYGQYGTMSRVVIGIRGIPTDGPPVIYGNFFNQPYHVSSTQDSISLTLNPTPTEADLVRDNRFKVAFSYRREGDKCVLGWLGQRQTVSCSSVDLGP